MHTHRVSLSAACIVVLLCHCGESAGGGAGPAMADGGGATRGDGTLPSSMDATVERFVQVVRDDGIDADLANQLADTLPGAADDPALAVHILYPYDQTVMPPNLFLVEWQWEPVPDADVYLTTFEGPTTTVHHASTENHFVLAPATWRMLAERSLNEEIRVTVRAARASDLSQAGSASIQIRLGPDDLEGGIYYFSTIADRARQGIYRYDFGVPVASSLLYLSEDAAGACVGCHALSRDGTRMGVSFRGGYGYLAEFDVANPDAYRYGGPRGPQLGAFVQFFDDDQGLLAIYDGSRDDPDDPLNGQIRVYDTTTGQPDDSRLAPIGDGHRATHLAVAPDGLTVAYVDYADVERRPIHEHEGSLRTIVYDPIARSWGEPRTLVPYDGSQNNYYPSFSPDGRWVLFNRAPGDAYDNPGASLWVVRADGSQPPIELENANRIANATNSWPRWAPFAQVDEFGTTRMWFTFSSKRDYGLRLVGEGRAQLWMASFEPFVADRGGDGSAPAFWLPFQNIDTPNHTAAWTERVEERTCETSSDCVDPALYCDTATNRCAPIDLLI